jgi:TolA-binding protein
VTPLDDREPYAEGAAALARLARLPERDDELRHAAGRERLLASLAGRSRPRAVKSVMWLAAALALAAVVGVVLTRRAAPLEYRVAGPALADGPWLAVPALGGALSIRFTDGTEVDLGPGSKGRVSEITARGARIVLGSGALQARVVHRPSTQWTVTAGPYTIEVTGTAFDVGWSTDDEELDLSLHDGSVVVRGPSLPEGLRVAAGQRLVARARTGEAQLSPLLASPAPVEAPAPAASADRSRDETSPSHPAPRPLPTWSEMLADGNFRGVVESAEARGIDAALNRGSLADVVALSDAARYLRDRALAKRGLLAERSRFPGSAEARGAAFVLGRMADDGGSRDEAIRWYETYLAESPGGSFAAEALGRELVARVDSGDAAAARAAAREYVRRFPHGAHAAYARDQLQEP